MTVEHVGVIARETLSKRAFGVLAETGAHLSLDNRITAMQLAEAHDVHAYYSLSSRQALERIGARAVNGLILHIQAYPGMSDEEQMTFMARLMDKGRLYGSDSSQAGGSLGNEKAVIGKLFEDRPLADSVPWDPGSLTELIEQGLDQ